MNIKENNKNIFINILSSTTRLDFRLLQNKIVAFVLFVGLLGVMGISILKWFPINVAYNTYLLTYQYVLFSIIVATIVSVFLEVSFLTYLASFLMFLGVATSLWINLFGTIFNSGNKVVTRIIIYSVSAVLTFAYIQWLKKTKKS